MSVPLDPLDAIAIVGMACRFPGARDYEEFWRAQREERFCVGEVPADRWSWQQFYSTRREDENKTVSKWGGFMADIDKFDAALFRISPREAELMDPQQRIMLELAWSCFEDAGKVLMALRHRTLPGIPGFAGAHANLASADQRFVFGTGHQPWPAPVGANGAALPRRAAINNFGFSGVNAHLVLEEAPLRHDPPDHREQPQLIVLSARTDAALRQAAAGLLGVLQPAANPATAATPAPLGDIAYTLQTGRAALNRRLAIVAASHAALAAALARHVESADAAGEGAAITGRVVPKGAAADQTQADAWAREQDLEALARHWVRGGAVDWNLLRPAGGARRVPLPGHPLSPRRYWVAGATGLSALHGQRQAATSTTSGRRARRRDIAAAG